MTEPPCECVLDISGNTKKCSLCNPETYYVRMTGGYNMCTTVTVYSDPEYKTPVTSNISPDQIGKETTEIRFALNT